MKNVYPIFLTMMNTNILVEVPDLEILTEGRNPIDALDMTRDAIELKCVSMEDDGIEIPLPSKVNELDANSATFAEKGPTYITVVAVDPVEYRRKLYIDDFEKNRKSISQAVTEIWCNKMIDKMQVDDSIYLHNMSREETEILGYFCDFTGISGNQLKRLLVRGYLCKEEIKRGEKNKVSNMGDMVRQAEEFKRGVDTLVQTRDTWRKEGGKVMFSVYTASGHDSCSLELTKHSVEKMFEILIGECNDQIRHIKSRIIEDLDSLITTK